ncbi:unnamed protein product [Alternaria alternata]
MNDRFLSTVVACNSNSSAKEVYLSPALRTLRYVNQGKTLASDGMRKLVRLQSNQKMLFSIVCTSCVPVDLPNDLSVEHQDSIYKTQNVGASNCLLQIPREYSLLQANCQHFILELIRRIGVDDEGDAYEKLENASQRPRTWCRSLLSCVGFILNCALALLPVEPMTCILLYMYHVTFSLVMIQDSTMRKLRIELSENEQRFCQNGFTDHRRRTRQKKELSNSTVLTILSLGMASPLVLGVLRLFKCWGPWAFGPLIVIVSFYYVFVYAFAYRLLRQLKSRNRIIGMRINDKKARVKKAYETLEDRWSMYDGTSPCPERLWWRSESSKEHCRKCFLDNVRREQGDWQTDFGRLDFEDAVSMWELNHPRPIEIEKLYEKRWMLLVYMIFGIPLMVWMGFYVTWPDPKALYVCLQST